MIGRLFTLAAVSAVSAGVSRAVACSMAGPQILAVVPTGTGAPPGAAGEVTYTVTRGKGPESSGCGGMSESGCDDIGSVALHFEASVDPDSDRNAVGYRLAVVGGAPPRGLQIESGPNVPFFDNGTTKEANIYLHWTDGATDEQERIDFSVTLTPVDSNGHEGPASPVVHIMNDGDGGGCSMQGGRVGSALVPVAALVIVLLRRGVARRFK